MNFLVTNIATKNCFRLCLVRVKAFPEKKMFSCVWLHFKIFFEKYFLVFGKEVEKEEGRGKTQKNPDIPRRTRHDLAIDGTISDHDQRKRCFARSRSRRRDLAKRRSRTVLRARSRRAISRSFSLSFSLCASPVPEIIWSENRNGNEFPWSTLLFYGQLKMISGKFNFPNQPNSLFYGKWFPETIFTQNKHSLRPRL